MTFTGGKGLGKVSGDDGQSEAGPGAEIIAFDCSKKSGGR
jgi:hypothetical protein